MVRKSVKRPEVVGHLMGGLGNQLFIFAAAWSLARRYDADLYLDTSALERDSFYKRKYALNFFAAAETIKTRNFPNIDLACRVYVGFRGFLSALPNRIGPILTERPGFETKFDPTWAPNSAHQRRYHVFGFRQNEAYFMAHAEDLRRELALNFLPSPSLKRFVEKLNGQNAVSVSFRRLHGVPYGSDTPDRKTEALDATYYARAVHAIRERVENPVFYCFGDSLENLDALLPSDCEKVMPPDTDDLPNDVRDFWLMQHCRHFIIANSTFSWWAAWLAQVSESIIVSPDTTRLLNKISPATGWLVV